jgi:uncharacterized protein YjiS (DUF1127 family)
MTNLTTNTTLPIAQGHSMHHQFARKIRSIILGWQAHRMQIASLRRLKSRDLRDIGLIEHDISAADRLPLSADVATNLYRASLSRSGNW